MRKTLILLSSLALAASSQAVEYASATTQLDVGYTLGANMTAAFNAVSVNIPSRAAGVYVYNFGAQGETAPQVYDFETGDPAAPSRYAASLSGGAIGSVFGNRLVLASTVSGALSGADGDLGVYRRYGYRVFLQVTNDADDAQDVTFDFSLQSRYASGSVDVPLDTARNFGQYAESGGVADVVETLTDPDYPEYDFFRDTQSSASGKDYAVAQTYPSGGFRKYSVPGKSSVEFQIYNSSYVFLEEDLAPVPEPASLLALGVGALGLLRRRRRRA